MILRAILAALPVLGFARQASSGFVYGVAGAGFFLLAVSLFLLIQPFLPRTLSRLFFLIFLLIFAAASQKIFSVSFLLLASFLLLSPPELFQKRKHRVEIARKVIWSSFIFFAFLSVHGALAEGLGVGWGIRFFQHPEGSYLLAGLVLTGMNKK